MIPPLLIRSGFLQLSISELFFSETDSAGPSSLLDKESLSESYSRLQITVENRWDEKAGLRRDAVRSQVIDVLEAQEIKETGNEEG
jgi:hypothetical protein